MTGRPTGDGLAPLAEIRRELGLSRERLAYLSGVSSRTIYRIEHREARPTTATLAVIAAVLGRDPNELVDHDQLERPAA